jgi:hypothetical protein
MGRLGDSGEFEVPFQHERQRNETLDEVFARGVLAWAGTKFAGGGLPPLSQGEEFLCTGDDCL